MKKYVGSVIIAFLIGFTANAQGLLKKTGTVFTHQDTLRGSITKERAWWDLKYYHLDIKVNPTERTITGFNTVRYTVLTENNIMQIDLQEPMQIYKVTQNGKELKFDRNGNAFFIHLTENQKIGETKEIVISYGGKPKEAVRPPWDGGLTWQKDKNGKDFIASTCQGLGASVWWPCKDHMYDEVENMLISVNVPGDLTDVSNGRLQSVKKQKDGTKTFNWYVSNPINNYGVNINIGDYVNFSEKYKGEKGDLDCNYYVLRDNLEIAKKQFQDAPKMLKALENWFGPYPFYEDSYKLVEAPYLGMEHQSSVTYGNGYKNGHSGTDISGTGWGLKFDYIIIHESGHEWFANNITYKDIADMWIHESFTTYSEVLFIEYYYGKDAANEYVRGIRKMITNKKPIIGYYDVNTEGSGDMYPKGANMIHTIRQVINDDAKWKSILRGLNSTFYHQTVTTKQIEDFISKESGIDLSPVFDQYLRTTQVPTFEYFFKNQKLIYHWINAVEKFDLPLKVTLNGVETWLKPTTDWKAEDAKGDKPTLDIDKNFYVTEFNITN
ncbi:M1 family metallopeptidase [Flavobacterium sp. ANB]|uniref:M1 family metallopeptidase n=1 Tax=unclassified Flavobacterium TaxID=196869 RepID=UPI0012B731D5|nr:MULTISPECIES: M1 family metallopeptidase [unclassified Flavobacterium]MBF4515908.1 M1 family metallopeptidase [Flavobacterium sp. ANB]MTD68910.1 M1 family peptidase [Flavobacterium sp. LC2016-13]